MPLAGPASEFVARARRRRTVRTLEECLALGSAASLVALAAGRWSPPPDASTPAPWALAACAALSGLALAATWWVERAKQDDLALARVLDARLRQDGALATVYEARVRGEAGALAQLLERRVAAGLDRASLQRAQPALGLAWLAPPAFAAALAALAFEIPASRGSGPEDSAYDTGAPIGGSARPRADARALLERARAQAAAALADPELRAQLAEQLDAAARELPSASRAVPDSAQALLRAELLAERAALIERARSAGEPDPSKAIAEGAAASPAARGGAGTAPEAESSLLTNSPPDRTMSGSNRPPAAADSARPPTSPAADGAEESGTLAGRWWDERYDPVVQGWRRALAARAERR